VSGAYGDIIEFKIGKIFAVGQTKHPVRLRLRGGGSQKITPQIIFNIAYTYLTISNHYIEYYVYIIYAGAAVTGQLITWYNPKPYHHLVKTQAQKPLHNIRTNS
jgi:hypothetical protein